MGYEEFSLTLLICPYTSSIGTDAPSIKVAPPANRPQNKRGSDELKGLILAAQPWCPVGLTGGATQAGQALAGTVNPAG